MSDHSGDANKMAPTARDVCDKVLTHLLMGLNTDGAHHKQWYLEQAVAELTGDEYMQKAKRHFGWEGGRSRRFSGWRRP